MEKNTMGKELISDRLNMLPDELKRLNTWLLWKFEADPTGKKPRKVPYYASGRRRNGVNGGPEDRTNLASFNKVMEAFERGNYSGLGIAMLPENGLTGIDLDNCMSNGEINAALAPLVEGTYREISPSGKGVRAFYQGKYDNRKHLEKGVEVFCSKGFLTVTGNRLNADGISPLSPKVRGRFDTIFAQQGGKSQKAGTPMEQAKQNDPIYRRLEARGLIRKDFGGGKFGIECPFSREHTTGDGDADCVYYLPHTNGYTNGTFHCFHAHCNERPQTAFLKELGIEKKKKPEVYMDCAIDIIPAPIDWIWEGYIARGKVHILAGPAGHGKTTVLIALGATITAGGRWPDGTHATIGNICIWSGEDDPADTIVPRLIACGANRSRVHIIKGITETDGLRSFDPARDMRTLREAMAGKNFSFLIIDPIASAVAEQSHQNSETRRQLQPIVDFAAELNIAVYGVTHFSKGTMGRDPVERVSGSLAFGAVTRLVMVAMKLPDEGDHPEGARLLARAKSNIGPDGGGFHYFIEFCEVPGFPGLSNTRVSWGDSLEGTAKELIAQAEAQSNDDGKLEDAMQWLSEILAEGPVKASDVLKEGRIMGFSKSTLKRAKKRLGVGSTKVGFSSGWGWLLPVNSAEGVLYPGVEPLREKTHVSY